MSTGPEDFRPKRRELALSEQTADQSIADPKWNLNSIVGDTRAQKTDISRYRVSNGPTFFRDSLALSHFSDRVSLTRQLTRALKTIRESTESARRPNQTDRLAEKNSEREQAERAKDQQLKTAEVSKKAKAMIALLKSNPDAVSKLASIAESPQGQGFAEVFASILLDKNTDKPDQELANKAVLTLAKDNPVFATKLATELVQQVEIAQSGPFDEISKQNLKAVQLAQVLSAPENKILLDQVVQMALAEPARVENSMILQELTKIQPTLASVEPNLDVAKSESIQLASLDTNLVYTQPLFVEPRQFTTAQMSDVQPDLTTANVTFVQADFQSSAKPERAIDAIDLVSSYTFSPELKEPIQTVKTLVNNWTPEDSARIEMPFKQAVQAEVYKNKNASLEQIRDHLSTEIGITQASKFVIEIRPSANERVLALVPNPLVIQERPEIAAVTPAVVSESEIQNSRVELQKLDKFILDLNTNTEMSMASRFAEFARSSSNSTNTALAFRQVIMAMSKGSNLTGRELAQLVKDELNFALSSSNLVVTAEADSIVLNTISEAAGTQSSELKPLATAVMEDAPAGSLSASQIEQIKTALVTALNDPFKMAALEQKLLQNGVLQSDIDTLKSRAFETSNSEQIVTDAIASERIRNDLMHLVSEDRNERILAAEDLRLNNITGLSLAGGEIGLALDKTGTKNSVQIFMPSQEPDQPPISVEMFSYGAYDADNQESDRMQEFSSAFQTLDYSGLPLQIVDKFGNMLTVSSTFDNSGTQPGESEDQNMYTEPGQEEDPNFNPYDYMKIEPPAIEQNYLPAGQYIPESEQEYDSERGYDPEQEFQNQDQEIPRENQQEYVNDYATSIQPDLSSLFSNDMLRRAQAAIDLAQNNVEVFVETSEGVFKIVAEQTVNEISRRDMFVVRLEDVNNPNQTAIIAEIEIENGSFSRYTPPAPPPINLTGARITFKYSGQTFSVPGEQLR